MTPQEMWNAYKQINPSIGDEIDAWAFGVDPDLLADLVFTGEKTATASAYDLYALEDEPLPKKGTFDVVLDSQDQAVCIIEITKVSVQPFHQVSADHALRKVKETNLWPIGVRFMRNFSRSGWRKQVWLLHLTARWF